MQTFSRLTAITAFGFLSLGFAAPLVNAATITVNSTADVAADDGQCTLREAITASNTNASSGATVASAQRAAARTRSRSTSAAARPLS